MIRISRIAIVPLHRHCAVLIQQIYGLQVVQVGECIHENGSETSPYGGVYFVPALTMVTKWSPTPPFALGQDPKGVLAGPGTPRDPKSHLFVTKWVAVAPSGTWGPRPGAEFRCESRQGGPTPSISTCLFTILELKNAKMSKFVNFLKMDCPSQGGFAPQGAQGAPCWGCP